MYVVYEPSGIYAGRILSTIAGPDERYGDEILTPNGQSWIFVNGRNNINPITEYVDPTTKAITQCGHMTLIINKLKFIANGDDEAIIDGIPPNANIIVFCNGEYLSTHVATDDGKIEIASDDVATFEVRITCHRYLPASVTLNAIEAPK